MNSYKSIVKKILFTTIFLSSSLFANQVLITDIKKTDYKLIESHLNYEMTFDEIDSFHYEENIFPVYKNEGVLLKLSSNSLKEELKNKVFSKKLAFLEKEFSEVKDDNLISFVMSVTF